MNKRKTPSARELELEVENFNLKYPIGTPVRARGRAGDLSKTRSEATLLAGHTPVVWIEGRATCIALSHVEVVKP